MKSFSCYSLQMSNQVRVIDTISETILFETSIENLAAAYSFATQMEAEGLDIKIIAPGLAETLIRSLGANQNEVDVFKEGLVKEIEDHDDSDMGCSICPPKKYVTN